MHAYIAFSVLNVVKVLADTFNKENKENGEGPSDLVGACSEYSENFREVSLTPLVSV